MFKGMGDALVVLFWFGVLGFICAVVGLGWLAHYLWSHLSWVS